MKIFCDGDLKNISIVVYENTVIVRWNDVGYIDIRLDDAAIFASTAAMMKNVLFNTRNKTDGHKMYVKY